MEQQMDLFGFEKDNNPIVEVVEERPITVKTVPTKSDRKKIDNRKINELFGIKESFELPAKLMAILLGKRTREEIFNEFLQYDFDFSHDCLRDFFQDEHAARSALKQDYTPDCICDLISMLMPETDRVVDLCAGTGALTIGSNRNVFFQCEELSKASIPILLFNLAIRGMNAVVLQKNVLDGKVDRVYRLTNAGRFSDIEICEHYEELKAKVVISNPPYSIAWKPQYDYRFEGYALAPKGAADYAFVLDGVSRLAEAGTALYILPHGVLFRGKAEAEIRQRLIENNLIDAVIGLPPNTFLNTGIPVFVLVLKKNRPRTDVLFIDSSKTFEKRGKQNILTQEHLEAIADAYWKRREVEKFSHVAPLSEIKGNDYNLNIPRYVDTFEKEELPPIEDITKEIMRTSLEIAKTKRAILDMLHELEGDADYNKAMEDFRNWLGSGDAIEDAMREWVELQGLERRANELVRTAKRTRRPILDICDFERVKAGKVYTAGTVYIQLSATDGVVRYLDEGGELDSKFGVFVPKDGDLCPRYLFYMLDMEMEGFLARYQCGMNINPEIFKHLQVTYYESHADRVELCRMLDSIKSLYEGEKAEKEGWVAFKKYHLGKMLI